MIWEGPEVWLAHRGGDCGQARGIICKCQSAAGSGAGSPDCCRGRGDRDFWVCRSRCSLRSAVSGQASAASWAALGGAVALMNLIIGGQAIAFLSVGLLTALTPVAIVSGAVPVAGAGLMAIMCLGVGLSAARGLHRGLLLIRCTWRS